MDFYYKAGLAPTGDHKVTTGEWVTSWVTPAGDPPDEDYVTAAYTSTGERPAFCFVPLGSVLIEDGSATILPSSAGNIGIYEHIAEIDTSAGTAVGTIIRRALTTIRETY